MNEELQKQKGKDFYSFTVDLEPTDKNRIKYFAEQERQFFNSLVENLGSRLFSFPESFSQFDEPYIQLFGAVAEQSFKLRSVSMRSGDKVVLPGRIENYRYLVFDKNTNRFIIPERMLLCFESAASIGRLAATTRRNMAAEILRFFQQQSKNAKSAGTLDRDTGEIDSYKTSFSNLVTLDNNQKRHVQLSRSDVSVVYDEKLEATILKTPYTAYPIKIPNMDMSKYAAWNLVLIHQEPNRFAQTSTPWLVEFRKAETPYLVKYVDFFNARNNSAYAIAKSKNTRIDTKVDYERTIKTSKS